METLQKGFKVKCYLLRWTIYNVATLSGGWEVGVGVDPVVESGTTVSTKALSYLKRII